MTKAESLARLAETQPIPVLALLTEREIDELLAALEG